MDLTIFIKVITRSNENKVIEDVTDMFGDRFLKIRTTEIPENNRANKAIIEILSDYFSVAKNKIAIIKGHKITNKVAKIIK